MRFVTERTNFMVSSKLLLSAIQDVFPAVPKKKPTLYILENILLELEGDTLTVSATNLMFDMKKVIEVESQGGTARAAVPAKTLKDVLSNILHQPISVSIMEEKIELVMDGGEYEISTDAVDDFPSIQWETTPLFSCNIDILYKGLKNTLFASSKDVGKHVLNAVYLNNSIGKFQTVATNGNQLQCFSSDSFGCDQEFAVVVPLNTAKVMEKLTKKANSGGFLVDNEFAFFQIDNVTIRCRPIDEPFPNYESIIPRGRNKVMTIDKENLIRSLEAIDVVSNSSTKLVQLDIHAAYVTIRGRDINTGNKGQEDVNCSFDHDFLKIGFNISMLLETCDSMPGGILVFNLIEANRPLVVKPEYEAEGESVFGLVMPLMLDEE